MSEKYNKNRKTLTKIDHLYHYKLISPLDKIKLESVIKRHPMKITDYYSKLIDWEDKTDPLMKISLPSLDELNGLGDYDTSGESSNTKLKGLQHKYKQTVLVLSTNVCYLYCRYCFRKRMVGYSKSEIMERMKETIDYVKKHKEVNNVLITGGDAFTLSNKVIEKYLKNLCGIDHLDFIRFGTKSLVVKPSRVIEDPELLNILRKYSEKKEIVIVTQFNHPREITEESRLLVGLLKEAGCLVRNQSVLLKGVNDDSDVLSNLFNKLTKIGIHPYYLFQCRPVKGVSHFQVNLERAINIVNAARVKLNGISKGFKFVMSHPRGKIEILGIINCQFLFKFHQSKYAEDDNMIFMIDTKEGAKWLDTKLNLLF